MHWTVNLDPDQDQQNVGPDLALNKLFAKGLLLEPLAREEFTMILRCCSIDFKQFTQNDDNTELQLSNYFTQF